MRFVMCIVYTLVFIIFLFFTGNVTELVERTIIIRKLNYDILSIT